MAVGKRDGGCRGGGGPPGAYCPHNPGASPLYWCITRHSDEVRKAERLQGPVEEEVIDRFLECGDPHHGFVCDICCPDSLLAYSCKTRYFCPSCQQKQLLLYGELVQENGLGPVPYRQYVFTVPRRLRPSYRAAVGPAAGSIGN